MELSHSCCLCGLRFSLVFKPHIVPDPLPIAGSELIMQLLLIKQHYYIFISIRLVIPQYLKGKQKGSASLGQWRKVSGGMVLEMHFTSVGRACSPHVSSLGDSHAERALRSSPISPSAFLLPVSTELRGGIPKVFVGSPKHSLCEETGVV